MAKGRGPELGNSEEIQRQEIIETIKGRMDELKPLMNDLVSATQTDQTINTRFPNLLALLVQLDQVEGEYFELRSKMSADSLQGVYERINKVGSDFEAVFRQYESSQTTRPLPATPPPAPIQPPAPAAAEVDPTSSPAPALTPPVPVQPATPNAPDQGPSGDPYANWEEHQTTLDQIADKFEERISRLESAPLDTALINSLRNQLAQARNNIRVTRFVQDAIDTRNIGEAQLNGLERVISKAEAQLPAQPPPPEPAGTPPAPVDTSPADEQADNPDIGDLQDREVDIDTGPPEQPVTADAEERVSSVEEPLEDITHTEAPSPEEPITETLPEKPQPETAEDAKQRLQKSILQTKQKIEALGDKLKARQIETLQKMLSSAEGLLLPSEPGVAPDTKRAESLINTAQYDIGAFERRNEGRKSFTDSLEFYTALSENRTKFKKMVYDKLTEIRAILQPGKEKTEQEDKLSIMLKSEESPDYLEVVQYLAKFTQASRDEAEQHQLAKQLKTETEQIVTKAPETFGYPDTMKVTESEGLVLCLWERMKIQVKTETTQPPVAPAPKPTADQSPESIGFPMDEQILNLEGDPQEASREAAKFVIARLNRFEELNAPNFSEAGRVFLKKALAALKELAVHGKSTGITRQKNLPPLESTDLDGRCAIGLIREAVSDSGLTAEEKKELQPAIKFVKQGGSEEGMVNIDTGGKIGIVISAEKRTAYLDHHVPWGVGETSATRMMFDLLVKLELLKADDNTLKQAVDFANQLDNETYRYTEADFHSSPKTLVGLGRNVEFKNLVKFFQNNQLKDIYRELTDTELREYGFIYKTKDGKKIDRSEQQRQTITQQESRFREMAVNGLVIDSNRYGKIAIDLENQLSFQAARAFGCDTYLKWVASTNTFFLSSLRPITDNFSQGIKMRDKMWITPADNPSLDESLANVLNILTDGNYPVTGELKHYFEDQNLYQTTALSQITRRFRGELGGNQYQELSQAIDQVIVTKNYTPVAEVLQKVLQTDPTKVAEYEGFLRQAADSLITGRRQEGLETSVRTALWQVVNRIKPPTPPTSPT